MLISCQPQQHEQTDQYVESVRSWHSDRVERLMQPDSWLSLVGLFWLDEGETRFGSSDDFNIVFPKPAPEFLGTFIRQGDSIWVNPTDGIEILLDGKPITNQLLLENDNAGSPTVLTYGSFSWYIIKRGERFGVRLKNRASQSLADFKGIEMFPIDRKWRVVAHLEESSIGKTIAIPNVLGQISEDPCPGSLVFELEGKTFRLDPIGKPDDESWFLIFADETSGIETYGAGRFLSIDAADVNGTTFIDFNKAYNPPCVFSEFATCPLPPTQNRLSIRIEAGEKNIGEH